FFRAEDGIRDFHVTGVQTCALPISYQQVSAGVTGHTEALQVTYDPSKVSYEKLLEVFWLNHDPTTLNRQFCDGGSQYRPGIFYQIGSASGRQRVEVPAGRGAG